MSKSKTRSGAAIGDSRVIPAQAGIQVETRRLHERNWAPAFAGATIPVVIRGERERGPESTFDAT